MILSRYAKYYLLLVSAFSIFQLAIGANFIVLGAIDLVCASAVIPLSRKSFDPTDMLFFSLCLYYGTFSLILKSIVLQPVQMNLVVPMLTSAYLVGGFSMILLAYMFTNRVMTSHYPGTTLRRWNLFERTFADESFLARQTLPITIISLAITAVLSVTSHSVQEVSNGLASSSGLSSLGELLPLLQLALAMQLSLMTRNGARKYRWMVFATFGFGVILTIFNNQKALMFWLVIIYVSHTIAYRIRVSPRQVVLALVTIFIAFFYVTPLVHIVRAMDVEKSDRLSKTVSVLQQADYNPIKLSELDSQLAGNEGFNSLDNLVDYLAPYNLRTDRFTELMPIDQIARADGRAPLGFGYYVTDITYSALPKYIVGEHPLEVLGDVLAWHYSLRGNGIISRPTLGFLGTGLGVGGTFGLLILGPFIILIVFMLIKLFCAGSIWQNPWAVFIASRVFLFGEADIEILVTLLRGFIPLMIIAYALIKFDHYFRLTKH